MNSSSAVAYFLLPFVILILYVAASTLQYNRLVGRSLLGFCGWIIGVLSVSLHGLWLHSIIDLPLGQDINFFNMLSFVVWLMGAMVVLGGWRSALQNLAIFIFPLAALSVLLVVCTPLPTQLRSMAGHPGQWAHIWLAALTFGLICMAALQAILLYMQDRLLHHYQQLPVMLKNLPALENMERLLFRMIGLGFLLLTLVCISSAYSFPYLLQPPLLKKTLLVFIAWSILLLLLLGRCLFGWRGRKAIGYTLAGFFVLIIIYFGSEAISL